MNEKQININAFSQNLTDVLLSPLKDTGPYAWDEICIICKQIDAFISSDILIESGLTGAFFTIKALICLIEQKKVTDFFGSSEYLTKVLSKVLPSAIAEAIRKDCITLF